MIILVKLKVENFWPYNSIFNIFQNFFLSHFNNLCLKSHTLDVLSCIHFFHYADRYSIRFYSIIFSQLFMRVVHTLVSQGRDHLPRFNISEVAQVFSSRLPVNTTVIMILLIVDQLIFFCRLWTLPWLYYRFVTTLSVILNIMKPNILLPLTLLNRGAIKSKL